MKPEQKREGERWRARKWIRIYDVNANIGVFVAQKVDKRGHYIHLDEIDIPPECQGEVERYGGRILKSSIFEKGRSEKRRKEKGRLGVSIEGWRWQIKARKKKSEDG